MKILKTKKRTFQITENEDGSVNVLNEFGKKELNAGGIIGNYGGLEKFKEALIEVKTNNFEKYLRENNLHPEQKAERRAKSQMENFEIATKRIAELEEKAKTEESAEELYSIFQEITRISQNNHFDRGWFDADFFFLNENALSKLLIKKLGTYTATPYDNGEIIIKAQGISYSNKRHPKRKSLHELISE